MLFPQVSQAMGAAIRRIKTGSEEVNRSDLAQLLAAAQQYKPAGYDSDVNTIRAAYEGRQEARLRSKLVSRYDVSGQNMALFPLNITRETAEIDAQVYRKQPKRWVENDSRETLEDNSADLNEALSDAHISVVTSEAERRAALVGMCVIKGRWSRIEERFGRKDREDLTPFWPSQIHVVPNRRAPDKLWASDVVMFELESSHPQHRTFEVWVRSELSDGTPLWRFGQVREDGVMIEPMRDYELPDLPAVALRTIMPCGHMFPAFERDIINTQDEINVALSDHWHKAAYQAHQQIYIVGGQTKKGQKRAVGPNVVWDDLPEGAQVGTIDSDYDNDRIDGIKEVLTMHGRSKRQPEHAWFTKGGNPETGTALRVKSINSDQKRGDHVVLFSEFEQDLGLMVAQHADTWGGHDIHQPGNRYMAKFHPPEIPQDPQAQAQYAIALRDAGFISDARAAQMAGAFKTEEEAAAAGLSTEIEKKQTPPQFGESNGQTTPEDGTEDTAD